MQGTCKDRSFIALTATQFFGALNDNLFKIMVSLLAISMQIETGAGVWGLIVLNLVFMAPYVLFSPFAGVIADHYSKSAIAKLTKVLEIAVMAAAWFFFWEESFNGLVVVLFFMGLQSTLFSPAKYGMLPEMLADNQLPKGNGYLNGWTFVAIIFGTALGGIVRDITPGSHYAPGLAVVLVALVGFVASLFIAQTPSFKKGLTEAWNPMHIAYTLREMRCIRGLILAVLAITYFWFVGAMYQLTILLYGRTELGLSETESALLITALGIGIGLGSIAAGFLSRGRIRFDYAPPAGLLMGIVGLAIFDSYSFVEALVVFFLLGASAGFYTVPLNAFIQRYSPDFERGRCIAATNLVSFVAMILSSLLLLLLIDYLHFKPHAVFQFTGVLSILLMLIVWKRVLAIQRGIDNA